jgi:hypothetical protein
MLVSEMEEIWRSDGGEEGAILHIKHVMHQVKSDSSLPAMEVVVVVRAGRQSPAAFLAKMEIVKSLFSSTPDRVKALADPSTNFTMSLLLPTPGQPLTV